MDPTMDSEPKRRDGQGSAQQETLFCPFSVVNYTLSGHLSLADKTKRISGSVCSRWCNVLPEVFHHPSGMHRQIYRCCGPGVPDARSDAAVLCFHCRSDAQCRAQIRGKGAQSLRQPSQHLSIPPRKPQVTPASRERVQRDTTLP